jgi:hypothetical protein
MGKTRRTKAEKQSEQKEVGEVKLSTVYRKREAALLSCHSVKVRAGNRHADDENEENDHKTTTATTTTTRTRRQRNNEQL